MENVKKVTKIKNALITMSKKDYWNKINSVEFIAFMTKIIIIFPGLIFNYQIWWLYFFALLSSLALIWTSTEKTLPTIIIFNMMWVILALISIFKHFFKNFVFL
jgi:hypothetical protein